MKDSENPPERSIEKVSKGSIPKYSEKFKDVLLKNTNINSGMENINSSNKKISYLVSELSAETSVQDKRSNVLTKAGRENSVKVMNQQSIPMQQKQKTEQEKSLIKQKDFFFLRVKSIGVGAHSFVYLVQQQATKCLYAQKAIKKSHIKSSSQLEIQTINEIKIQYKLEHDNLIKLYHFYADEDYLYLVMQYAQESLFNLKNQFKIFKEKEIIQILRQLLHGLKFMHRYGYIHADLKIQNIMIRNGRIKLCDFGFASKFTAYAKIDPNSIIGTLQYLSPEYVQGEDRGPLRDIWAVGILCFQLWTGRNPLEGLKQNQKWLKLIKTNYRQFLDQIKKISAQEGRNSEKVQKIIECTLCPWQNRFSAQKILQLQFFQS